MTGFVAWLLLLLGPPAGEGESPERREEELLFRAIAESLAAEFQGSDLSRVSRALRRIADEMDALATPAEPEEAGQDEDEILAFLLANYDADGDGRVREAEYGRGAERFQELDGNGDGQLDAEDIFGGFRSGRQMQEVLDATILLRCFRRDPEAEELSWDDLVDTFDEHDTDQDGVLTEEEFAPLQRKLQEEEELDPFGSFGLGGGGRRRAAERAMQDSYARLVALGDDDPDGEIYKDALLAYFDEHDEDLDGMLDGDAMFGPRSRPGGGNQAVEMFGREEEVEPVTAYDGTTRGVGAPAGKPAPDFTLEPLKGGPSVTLSAFRDQRPVALIFGSYT